MIPEEYVRIIIKHTQTAGATPSVPTDDTDLNSFTDTDIFEGELFYNVPDEILYTRSGSNIVNLNNEYEPTVTSLSTNFTADTYDIYEVTGTSSVVATLPSPAGGEITFKKMDGGGDLTFSEDIDGDSSYSLENEYEAVTIAYDGSEWIIISYYEGNAVI